MALNLSKNDNSASGDGGNKKIQLNLKKKEITPFNNVENENQDNSENIKRSNKGLLYIVIGLLIFGAGIFIYQYNSNSAEVVDGSISEMNSILANASPAPQNEAKSDSSTGSQMNASGTVPVDKIETPKTENQATESSISQLVNTKNTQIAYFDAGSEQVLNSAEQSIELIIKYLTENKSNRITLLGYASSEGDPGKNLILSENRAKRFKEYLVAKGVSRTQINTRGEGSEKPIADNSTLEGRQKNRRVEFILE